jgi:Spy/CpxP family protein refolding chaperone
MMLRLRVYALSAFLLIPGPALWAQQAAPSSGEQQAQRTEERQRRLAERKAAMEQRRAEMQQRRVESAKKRIEMAEKRMELAKKRNPLSAYAVSPEFAIQHQQDIGLSEDQKNAIQAESQRVEAQVTELQGQLDKEREVMASLVKQASPNEQQILAQLDTMLNLEREIKRTRLTLGIRIRSMLTHEQQMRLQEMQEARYHEAQNKLLRAEEELKKKLQK